MKKVLVTTFLLIFSLCLLSCEKIIECGESIPKLQRSSSTTTTTSSGSNRPQTGDKTNVGLHIVLIVVSTIGLVTIFVTKKKHKR